MAEKSSPRFEMDPELGEVEVREESDSGWEDKEPSAEGSKKYFSEKKGEDLDGDMEKAYIPSEPNTSEPGRSQLRKRRSPRAPLKKGQIAHYHDREKANYDVVSEPCVATEYRVKNVQGIRLNERLYRGLVVVPMCTANYLNMVDQESRKVAEMVHSNRGRSIDLGEVK